MPFPSTTSRNRYRTHQDQVTISFCMLYTGFSWSTDSGEAASQHKYVSLSLKSLAPLLSLKIDWQMTEVQSSVVTSACTLFAWNHLS